MTANERTREMKPGRFVTVVFEDINGNEDVMIFAHGRWDELEQYIPMMRIIRLYCVIYDPDPED